MEELLPPLLRGLTATVVLTAGGGALALLLSFGAGFGRLSPDPVVRGAAGLYVQVFRGTSALVQLFWFYFALPMLTGIRPGAMAVGVLVLGLNGGAYGAEIVRGAIRGVPQGQVDAALALDLGPRARLFHVLLPQSLPEMIPPFGNLLVELLKGSALVSLVTVTDLTLAARFLRDARPDRTGVIFGLVLVLYFAISLLLAAATRFAERRFARFRRGEARP